MLFCDCVLLWSSRNVFRMRNVWLNCSQSTITTGLTKFNLCQGARSQHVVTFWFHLELWSESISASRNLEKSLTSAIKLETMWSWRLSLRTAGSTPSVNFLTAKQTSICFCTFIKQPFFQITVVLLVSECSFPTSRAVTDALCGQTWFKTKKPEEA